jgi:hypothetical protein
MDLVVALGVYHQARDDAELRASFAETARVLAPGGLLLLSVFAREMLGPDATPVAGQRFAYEDPRRGRCVRVTAGELAELLEEEGLSLRLPVETRRKKTEREQRVSLLAILSKGGIHDAGRGPG